MQWLVSNKNTDTVTDAEYYRCCYITWDCQRNLGPTWAFRLCQFERKWRIDRHVQSDVGRKDSHTDPC
ncbi:hypothetical protein GCM10009426_00720 [Rheinheimera tangshanensis]|nr:hypothetical protein GCM10010920_00560 [Rheinheimera tangshanensis]